jgi:replicative DNA helicase
MRNGRWAPVSVPPHDLPLERAVLGMAMFDAAAARRIAGLDVRLFFLQAHQRALVALRRCVDPADALAVSLVEWRLASGIEDELFWALLIEEGHVPAALSRLIDRLREFAIARAWCLQRSERA